MGKYTLEMILRPLGARTGGGKVIGFSDVNTAGSIVEDSPATPAVCSSVSATPRANPVQMENNEKMYFFAPVRYYNKQQLLLLLGKLYFTTYFRIRRVRMMDTEDNWNYI